MGKISLGANEILRISLGVTEIQKVSLGLSEIWSAAAVAPKRMGLYTTADYTGPVATWFNPTTWAARSEYPDTVFGSGTMILPAGNYRVTSNIIHQYDYDIFGIRVKDSGGNVLATAQAQYYDAANDLLNTTFTHPGGTVTIELYSGSNFSNAHIIKAGSFMEVFPTAEPQLQGLYKNVLSQSISQNTWTTITGWIADVAAHPGTTITSDGFTVVGTGPVKLNGYARLSGTNVQDNRFRFLVNGQPVGPEFINPNAMTAEWNGSLHYNAQNGDLVQFQGYATAGVSNRREFSGNNDKLHNRFEILPATAAVKTCGANRTATYGPIADSAAWTRVNTNTGWVVPGGYVNPAVASDGGIDVPAGTYSFIGHMEWGAYSTLTNQNARIVDASGNVLASWLGNNGAGHYEGSITAPGGKIFLELSVQSSFTDRRTLAATSRLYFG